MSMAVKIAPFDVVLNSAACLTQAMTSSPALAKQMTFAPLPCACSSRLEKSA